MMKETNHAAVPMGSAANRQDRLQEHPQAERNRKKMWGCLWLALLLAAALAVCICLPKPRKDVPEIYRNLINSRFDVFLTEENSTLFLHQDWLSIDPSWVAGFEVEPDHVSRLLASNLPWNAQPAEWVQKYITAYVKWHDELRCMEEAAGTGQCYALLQLEERLGGPVHSAILLLDAEQGRLYVYDMAY